MKKGSATLVVILSAVVTILYASSTYADVKQLKKTYEEYEGKIIEIYENEYERDLNEI